MQMIVGPIRKAISQQKCRYCDNSARNAFLDYHQGVPAYIDERIEVDTTLFLCARCVKLELAKMGELRDHSRVLKKLDDFNENKNKPILFNLSDSAKVLEKRLIMIEEKLNMLYEILSRED